MVTFLIMITFLIIGLYSRLLPRYHIPISSCLSIPATISRFHYVYQIPISFPDFHMVSCLALLHPFIFPSKMFGLAHKALSFKGDFTTICIIGVYQLFLIVTRFRTVIFLRMSIRYPFFCVILWFRSTYQQGSSLVTISDCVNSFSV